MARELELAVDSGALLEMPVHSKHFVYCVSSAPLAAAAGLTIGPGSVVVWRQRGTTEYAIVREMGELRDHRGTPKLNDTTRSDFGGTRVWQGDLVALPPANNGWYRVKWPGDDFADLTHEEYMLVAKQEVKFASGLAPLLTANSRACRSTSTAMGPRFTSG